MEGENYSIKGENYSKSIGRKGPTLNENNILSYPCFPLPRAHTHQPLKQPLAQVQTCD